MDRFQRRPICRKNEPSVPAAILIEWKAKTTLVGAEVTTTLLEKKEHILRKMGCWVKMGRKGLAVTKWIIVVCVVAIACLGAVGALGEQLIRLFDDATMPMPGESIATSMSPIQVMEATGSETTPY